MPLKILFICTGNICRSPLAEAILRHKVTLAGRCDDIIIDSAGTHDYHVGERPDPRTIQIADLNGISTDGIRARQVKMSDFDAFDVILGMDREHVQHLKKMAPAQYHPKIHLYLDYTEGKTVDVADPYYGSFQGFADMFDILDRSADELI